MDVAIQFERTGGPDRLQPVASPPQDPGPGEIRLRHEAIGVNFIDTYHRTGLYPLPPPGIPGVEGAGIVEALGQGVDGLAMIEAGIAAGSGPAYPLADAARAHADLEAGHITGSAILVP